MKFSNEIIKEYEDFINTGKSGLDLISEAEQDSTITIDKVINRLQVLCDSSLIGSTKSEKGWLSSNKGLADLSKNDPYLVRLTVDMYDENGYSSFALKEIDAQFGLIRIPFISSYSSTKRLIVSGKVNEKCIGLMNTIARAYKINIDEDGYSQRPYVVSKGVIGNATVTFNTTLKGNFQNASLADAEKLVVVLDVVTKRLVKKQHAELNLPKHDLDGVLHASNLVVMLNFLSTFNLGDDKLAIYSALALQLSNTLATLSDEDLKTIAVMSKSCNQKLCEKFSIKVGKYDYKELTKKFQEEKEELDRQEKIRQEKLKAEEQARTILKSNKVVKLTTLSKTLDKIITKLIVKELDKSSKAFQRVTSSKTKQKYYDKYFYYEMLLGVFTYEKEKSTHVPNAMHKHNNELAYKVSVGAVNIVNLKETILQGIEKGDIDLRGIAGPLATLNKYCKELFGLDVKKLVLSKLNEDREAKLDDDNEHVQGI